MFDQKETMIYTKLRSSLMQIDSELAKIPDFSMKMKLRVTSPILPDFIMSKYRDDVSVQKKGNSIRLDFSLLPKGNKDMVHQSTTMIYNPLNLDPDDLTMHNKIVLVNHERRTFTAPFGKVVHKEKQALLKDIFFMVAQKNKDYLVNQVKVEDLRAFKVQSRGIHKIELKFMLNRIKDQKLHWKNFPQTFGQYTEVKSDSFRLNQLLGSVVRRQTSSLLKTSLLIEGKPNQQLSLGVA